MNARPHVRNRRSGTVLRSTFVFPAAVLLSVFTAGSLHAQAGSRYEEGIMELVAERLAPVTTIVLIDSAGSVLLPVELIASHLGLGPQWSGPSIGIPGPGGTTARFDTASGELITSIGPVHLSHDEYVVSNAILYLGTDRLAALLEADVQIDMATLSVMFTRETPFPAQQRAVAEQRRAVLLQRQRQLERRSDLGRTPYAPSSGAGIIDWEIGTTGLDPSRLTTIRTDAGVAVLGGDLRGGATFQFGDDVPDAVHDPTVLYHRVFPHNRFVRQVQAGDMLTNGLFSRYTRGIEISNKPFLRSGDLGSIIVAPDLPAGWQYEVFQGNQLIGYSDIGGTDPVPVRLRTGTTPVEVRMFGPGGEEVVNTLVYQMPVSMIPRDSVEYALGGGQCIVGCDTYAHADVRYGASEWFTFGGGFELMTVSKQVQMRPYFVYSFATGTYATAEITYMPFAMYAANIALHPRSGSSIHVRGNIARPGFGPISIVRSSRDRWDSEVFWDERLSVGSFFSQFRVGASAAGPLGSTDRWRVSGMGSFRRGWMEARYDHDRISLTGSMMSGRVSLFTPFQLGSHRMRPLLHGALGANRDGLQLAELGVSIQPRNDAVITAGAQWNRNSASSVFSIGYSATIGSVHSTLRAITNATGGASSSFIVRGSSSFDHDGSVTFQPWSRTGYAGLHGTIFVDRDGDGRYSAGDEVVPYVHLIIGGHRVATDEDGTYRIWSLHPYEPIAISIDSVRTADPGWTTSVPEYLVRPAPNMALRMDVQLVRTRELIGTVEAARGVATAGGLTLVITNIATNGSTTTVTFSDGTFYVSRMRPGRYRITVAETSLEVLRARAMPDVLEFEVPVDSDDPVVELETITLERR